MPVLACPAEDCEFDLAVPESILDVRRLLTCPEHERILVEDDDRRGHECPDSSADRVITAAGDPCPFCGIQEGERA